MVSVRAMAPYEFPSADRQEVFGEDQLVYVHWRGNPLFCAAAAFRAPQAMPFEQFVEAMVDPWAGSDPSYTPTAPKHWELDGQPFTPEAGRGLRDQGVGHKSLVIFRT